MITSKEEAFAALAKYGITPPANVVYNVTLQGMPIQEFMATRCYLERNKLMPTFKHVDVILDLMFYPEKYGFPHWFTMLYSTIKKSIKTTITGIVADWVAETWEGQQELIYLASDAEQSKDRGFKAFREILEKNPRYNRDQRLLYGPNNEKLWSITNREAIYLPDNSFVKYVSSDYAGESGGNPTATFYTELWTWRLEKEEKLWLEMTVPPTRPKGFRLADTYAGYSGQSNILWKLWQRLTRDGHRLTLDEFPIWHELFPDEETTPFYIDIPSRTFGYIDQGVQARRFPWQQGEAGDIYYQQERAAALHDSDYLRLHENVWSEPTEALMPITWFDNCTDTSLRDGEENALKDRAPVLVSIDASVTHDCTAMTLHSRHPKYHQDTVVRKEIIFDPRDGGEINYDTTILPQLVEWRRRYNIVEIDFDPTQLSYLMQRVEVGRCGDIPMPDGSIATLPAIPCRTFNQMNERIVADTMFVTMVRDRHCWHDGTLQGLRQHILNADSIHDTHENRRLRIVKRSDDKPIDCAVAASMGNKATLDVGI